MYMDFIINEKQERLLKEYLDKEYGMPLYNYLKAGDKYSKYGRINYTEQLVPLFFYWITDRKYASDEDYQTFKSFCRNDDFLGKHLLFTTNQRTGGRIIKALENTNAFDYENEITLKTFIKKYKGLIFKKLVETTNEIGLVWDKFFEWSQFDATNSDFVAGGDFEANVTYMNPQPFAKREWLVHLVANYDDALDIMANGFTYGMQKNDMDKLNYSRRVAGKDKENGVYSYAYDAKDIVEDNFWHNSDDIRTKHLDKDVNTRFDGFIYKHAIQVAVMFQASGVKAYHFTDEDEQVIFNNKTANNFVLLCRMPKNVNKKDPTKYSNMDYVPKDRLGIDTNAYKTKEGDNNLVQRAFVWSVIGKNQKPIYQHSSFSHVVSWVMTNYEQYRKSAVEYKNFMPKNDEYHETESKYLKCGHWVKDGYFQAFGASVGRILALKNKIFISDSEYDYNIKYDEEYSDVDSLYMKTKNKDIADYIKKNYLKYYLKPLDYKEVGIGEFDYKLYCFKFGFDDKAYYEAHKND